MPRYALRLSGAWHLIGITVVTSFGMGMWLQDGYAALVAAGIGIFIIIITDGILVTYQRIRATQKESEAGTTESARSNTF
jgi:hypothetical protein